MGKYIGLFFCALVILCSCNDNTPDGVLGEKEMTGLLADVHLANGTLLQVSAAPDTLYKYGTGRYQNLFKNHHTDSAQFNKSLKYYASEPDKLLAIYDEALKILQKKADSLSKAFQKETEANAKKQNKNNAPVTGTFNKPDTTHLNRFKSKFKRQDTTKLRE
jgi:hypothetical protein